MIGWMKTQRSPFNSWRPDGTLAPLDFTVAALASQADGADVKANKAGIIGVSSLIAARRIEEQNTGRFPSQVARSCIRARYGTDT